MTIYAHGRAYPEGRPVHNKRPTYAERVRELEGLGLDTSDAQAVADAEVRQGKISFNPVYPNDTLRKEPNP